MLDGANGARYSDLKTELDNDYAKGVDTYPTDRNGVLRLLNSRKNCTPIMDKTEKTPRSDLMFAQDEVTEHRRCEGKCFACRGDHLKRNCLKR